MLESARVARRKDVIIYLPFSPCCEAIIFGDSFIYIGRDAKESILEILQNEVGESGERLLLDLQVAAFCLLH